MNHDEGADYGTHPEWAERVEPRPDYTPKRNPMLGVITGLAMMAALMWATAAVFVLAGVLR